MKHLKDLEKYYEFISSFHSFTFGEFLEEFKPFIMLADLAGREIDDLFGDYLVIRFGEEKVERYRKRMK